MFCECGCWVDEFSRAYTAGGKELASTLEYFEVLQVSVLRVDIKLHFCHRHIDWNRSAGVGSADWWDQYIRKMLSYIWHNAALVA